MMEAACTPVCYDGKEGQLYRIWGINLLLKIVTLGIYGFWGKTRLRRYIVSSFSIAGDRLEYTGTGGQLFLGFLKALPIIIVVYAPFIIWPAAKHPLVHFMLLPLFFLIYAGTYTGLRYRLSHTLWRGVRSHLSGSALHYASLCVGTILFNIITLGIFIPYSDVATQRYMISNMNFGSERAELKADASKLMNIHIITLFLAIPTLTLSRFWYKAAFARHIYASLHISTLGFEGKQTAGNMLGLVAGNLLLFVISLGFAIPLIIQRNMQYIADNVSITGDMENCTIFQSDAAVDKSGEGIYALLAEQDIGLL